ncbi:MAG: aspartate--tRNA ligase [Oligoflexia bacterium]|nr:aspartate--tRNA ligase [Oligoflexia bacterium]
MRRTHTCSQLGIEHVGKKVALIGWVNSVRDHGGVLFIDLRDREGMTQLLVDPKNAVLDHAISKLKPETVVEVKGDVIARDQAAINPNMKTGSIEIKVSDIYVHNVPAPLPFQVDDSADKVNEELRLKYRYLDLRRPRNFETIRLRHRAVKTVRDYLDGQGFLEIETPMLFKSTPEGAREFLVPSRLNVGQFYALPQSPQQYKQMLMVAGMERYFQVARCFRDEDLRADRQPEFSQIDLEMSFIDREDIYALIEGMLKCVWKTILGVDIKTPFLRMPYKEAMSRFGVDKPDMRFGFELVDLNAVFANSGFKVFKTTIEKGGVVKAVNLKGLADVTTGEVKQLEDAAKNLGAPGLAFIKSEGGTWKSPILKFFSAEEQAALKQAMNVEEGDLVLFSAGEWERACTILGRLRLEGAQMLAKRGKITINPNDFKFLWVVDFPLMIFDEEKGGYFSAHHPFTAPVEEDIFMLDSDPKKVRGQHYDIVLNGVELGGGSIRIHQPELQKKVFEDVLQIPKDLVESRFGYMLEAFRFGAPPHGGIALGLDRLIAILANKASIRDVIAFPKTQKGQELMTQSPGAASEKQLRDLHIKVATEVK